MTTATSLVPEMHSLRTSTAKGKQPMAPPVTTEVPRSGRSRPSTPPPAVVKQRRRSRSRYYYLEGKLVILNIIIFRKSCNSVTLFLSVGQTE